MKRIIVVLLTPVFVLIQIFKNMYDLIHPVSSGMAELTDELINDMYEFWKKIFKWKE